MAVRLCQQMHYLCKRVVPLSVVIAHTHVISAASAVALSLPYIATFLHGLILQVSHPLTQS
jgi:hypothetical protein